MDPASVRLAYELIGRVVVEFAKLDRIIIAETWRAKFGPGTWPDGIGVHFRERLNDWARLHRPKGDQAEFNEFVERVRQVGKRRDEFVHSITEIADRQGSAWIAVTRMEMNWRKKFEKWSRLLHLPPRARPPQPAAFPEHEAFDESDVSALLADILTATEQVRARSLAPQP